MCVYHYEDSKRAQVWICVLLLAAILFSLAAAAPMFIVTYPGDECLLFVSVRGEALIYGNPAGCNFIAYGHCVVLLLGKIPIFQKSHNLRVTKKFTISGSGYYCTFFFLQPYWCLFWYLVDVEKVFYEENHQKKSGLQGKTKSWKIDSP